MAGSDRRQLGPAGDGGERLLSRRHLSKVLLTGIPIVFLILVFFIPIGQMFRQSLYVDDALSLGNYTKMMAPLFGNSLAWTFQLAFTVSIFSLLVAYPLAYVMANGSNAVRMFLLVCVLLPLWTSSLVRVYSWVQILGARGVVNTVLISLGLINRPLRLLYNPFAVYVGTLHVMLPYMVLCLYSSMINIDKNLVRTAETLGAGRIRAFFLVYVPQTMPGIASGTVLVFIHALGFYTTPAVLGGSGLQPFVVQVRRYMDELLDWPFAAALGTVLVLLTFGLYLLVSRHLGLATRSSDAKQSGSVSSYRLFGAVDRLLSLWRRLGLQVPGSVGLRRRVSSSFWLVVTIIIALALALPVLLVVFLSFSSSYAVVFPPPGYSFRLFQLYFAREDWMDATVMSFIVAFATAILTTALAVSAGLGLRNMAGGWRAFLSGVMLIPMMVPTIVIGVAVYLQFVGIIGMDRRTILILTHSALAIPPALLLLLAAMQGIDQNLENAAASLGASPVRQLRHIILPLIFPAAIACALVAFLSSFDDLGVALFITNNETTTLPRRMFDAITQESDPRVIAASAFLIIVSLITMLGIHLLQRRITAAKAQRSG